MATAERVLLDGLTTADGADSLVLDPRFQGLPDAAHGGSLLAAFLLLAGGDAPRRVRGLYRRRVPLGVPLALARKTAGAGTAFSLCEGSATVLVEGEVGPAAGEPGGTPAAGGEGHPLPVSSTCFACGVDNSLGLGVRLEADALAVRGRWLPREPLASADGRLSPLAVTTLLDEVAFWLGALATGESGMTTDLAVTIHRTVAFGTPLAVEGARASARAHAGDPRYWDTEAVARDDAGRLVASSRITFVAVRGSARRLVRGLLAINPPDVLRRVFPAYTATP